MPAVRVRTSWETAEATTGSGAVGAMSAVGVVGAGAAGAVSTTAAGTVSATTTGGVTVGVGGWTVVSGATGTAVDGKASVVSTAAKRLSEESLADFSSFFSWPAGTTISVNPFGTVSPGVKPPSTGVADNKTRGSNASIRNAVCARKLESRWAKARNLSKFFPAPPHKFI